MTSSDAPASTPASTPEPTPASTSTSPSTPTLNPTFTSTATSETTPTYTSTPPDSPSNPSQQSASSSILSGINYTKTQKLALTSLILGAASLFICIIIASGNDYASGFSGLFYAPVSVIITIICVILLIMCLRNISKYKFQNKSLWIMPSLGVILSVTFWIWYSLQ